MNKKQLLTGSFIICYIFIIFNGVVAGNSVDTVETDLNGIIEIIRDELDGYVASDLLIIKGSDLYIQEEILMGLTRLQIPKINQIKMVMDSNINNNCTCVVWGIEFIYLKTYIPFGTVLSRAY